MQSAASQSQHVVNILTSDDPVSGADVSELAKAEAETNTSGRPEKGGPAAQAQVSCHAHQAASKKATFAVANSKHKHL